MPSKLTIWKQIKGLMSGIPASAGVLPTANLGTGTANSTTFLRGDQTWDTPAAGSGDVATDAIWDAAADLVVGTGANTAARLAKGTDLQTLRVNTGATALEWADPGLGTLNTLSGATQTFDVGTAGTDLAWSSATTIHTLNLPDAGPSARGAVTTGSQTIAGEKTFEKIKLTALSDVVMFTSQPFATQTANQVAWNSIAGSARTVIDNDGWLIVGSNSWVISSTFNSTLWNGAAYGWGSSGSVARTTTVDTALYRDGSAGTIAARVTTTPNSFRVYNTWTSATNYERATVDWVTTANTLRFGTEKGSGGGTARDFALVTDATVRITIGATTGVATFSNDIVATKIVRAAAETTSTPSGTTQTVTLNDGNHQTLALTSATGTVTLTLTVPTTSSAGTLIIKQHASAAKDLTWAVSAGTIKWLGTEPDWAADAVSSIRLVSWRWDGSLMFFAATEVAA